METVETYLGNALWVMLKPEKQVSLRHTLNKDTDYYGRMDFLSRFKITELFDEGHFGSIGTIAEAQKWYGFRWEAMPHPTSWPKEHSDPPIQPWLVYTDREHRYWLSGISYLYPTYVQGPDGKGENLYPVYVPGDQHLLLTYSDLMIKPFHYDGCGVNRLNSAEIALGRAISWINKDKDQAKRYEHVLRLLTKAQQLIRGDK